MQQQQYQENNKENAKEFKVDQRLANGPLAERGCTDILFCILFLMNIGAFIAIGLYGYSKGHPERLLVPYDSDKRACGIDADVKNAPYIFLPIPYKGYFSRAICLEKCPGSINGTSKDIEWNKTNFKKNSRVQPDTKGAWEFADFKSIGQSIVTNKVDQKLNQTNYLVYYQTKGIFGRFCMPYGDQTAEIQNELKEVLSSSDRLEQYVSDLKVAWGTILGSFGIAFIIAFVYMFVLRFCAGVITWLTILLYFALVIGLGYLFFRKGGLYQQEADKMTPGTQEQQEKTNDAKTLKYAGYAIWGWAGLSFIIFLCLFNKIRQAIAIIKSAALFVSDVKSTLLVPPVIAFISLLFLAYWVVAYVYVYSMGEITGSPSGPFATVKWEKNTRYMLFYHIFAGLWINAFLQSLIQFILATACVLWYFSQPQSPHLPVSTGVKRGLFNHLGSLAFGAFILALVQFVRLLLEMTERQAKQAGADQNVVIKYFIKCMKCYAECFERTIKFLNKNAFIQIALTGKNFCAAALDAFQLILSNPVKFGLIATIGDMFIFIGKLFIASLTGLVCYVILTQVQYYEENLFSPILPTAFCVVIGFFIGSFFMSVYGMGVDSILQCVCLDEQLMKEQGKDPSRCPGPLREYFEGQAQ